MDKVVKEKVEEIKEKAEYGIKETSEVIDGACELALFIIPIAKKEGFLKAVKQFYQKMKTDEAFEKKILDAFDKIQDVPKEAKNYSLMELSRLSMKLLAYIPSFIAVLKED